MKKKRKEIHLLISFVLFLIIITYISYMIYIWRLPRVVLGFSDTGSFTRVYEMWGTLELTSEYPGYDAMSRFFITREELPEWNEEFGYEGDQVWVNIKALQGAQFYGVIHDIDYTKEGVSLIVKYSLDSIDTSYDIKSGEDVTAYYSSVTDEYSCIVPSSAIYMEGDETYVYVVRESKGIVGREFMAIKERVYIEDEWNGKIAINVTTSTIDEPIIINADSSIRHGARVRFYP